MGYVVWDKFRNIHSTDKVYFQVATPAYAGSLRGISATDAQHAEQLAKSNTSLRQNPAPIDFVSLLPEECELMRHTLACIAQLLMFDN